MSETTYQSPKVESESPGQRPLKTTGDVRGDSIRSHRKRGGHMHSMKYFIQPLSWLLVVALCFLSVSCTHQPQISTVADSTQAKDFFQDRFGFAPGETVSGLWFGRYWKRDSYSIMRFQCDDPQVVEAIVKARHLQPSKAKSGLWGADFPSWWPESRELEKMDTVFAREIPFESFEYVWVDGKLVYWLAGTV